MASRRRGTAGKTAVLDAILIAAARPTRYNRRRLAAARQAHSAQVTAAIETMAATRTSINEQLGWVS